MIIWTRWGIVGVLIPFGMAILSQLLLGETPIFAGIGYLGSAIPVWLIGKKWNFSEESKNKHTLFWIHLEYYGILAGLIGLMIIVSETIIPLETDTYFIIFGLTVISILIHQYSKSKSSPKDILSKLAPIRIIEPEKVLENKNSIIKENSAYNPERELNRKESLSSNNKMSETRKAIDQLKNKKVVLKKFEPSDHSRFMPPNSKSSKIISTDISADESEESENSVDEN